MSHAWPRNRQGRLGDIGSCGVSEFPRAVTDEGGLTIADLSVDDFRLYVDGAIESGRGTAGRILRDTSERQRAEASCLPGTALWNAIDASPHLK